MVEYVTNTVLYIKDYEFAPKLFVRLPDTADDHVSGVWDKGSMETCKYF